MTDWWTQVSEYVERAIDATPEARAALLSDLAARDRALHDEVASLLAAWKAEGGRFEKPVAGPLPGVGPKLRADETLGPYRIVREIGHGGMGTVFEARREDDDFRKRVAIKTIAFALSGVDATRRFRRERRILARLEHRNIASLLDGGLLPDGSPWFAMEFVEGVPIDQYCDEQALTLAQRLQLFRQVCDAVQMAHQNLVVHRDLKPGNILVTTDGTAKLLDFGIARVLSGDDDVAGTEQTALQGGPYTLAYASPEQVRGDPITTSSDVHALGVVLFRILTGRHPFREGDPSPGELRRRILESPTPTASLGGDLDAILGKAMAKDPARRYPSAQQFSEDLRRFLAGEPVVAQPDSAGYRLTKFVRRNRLPVLASGLAIASLIVAVVVSLHQSRMASLERDRARLEAAKANQVTAFVQAMLRSPDPRQAGRDVTVSEALAEASLRADSTLGAEPEVLATVKTAIGLSYLSLGRYKDAEPLLRHALTLRQAGYGSSNDLAASLHDMGVLHNDRGELAPAESLFAQSLTVYRNASPVDSSGLAQVISDHADLLQYRGDLAGAEAGNREALAIRERLNGRESEPVAASMNNLAVVLGQEGQWALAESLHIQSANLVRRLRGSDHPDVAAGLTSAAFAVQMQGRLADAESLYRAALEIREKVLGPGHPETARTHMNLGWLLHDAGRCTEALDEASRVLAQRSDFGDEHPAIASTLTMKGECLLELGRLAQGEAVLRDALTIRERALPSGHWLIAASRSSLGEALILRGRYAEAGKILQSALDVLKKERGESHELVKLAKKRLALLYTRWGKPNEAAKYKPD